MLSRKRKVYASDIVIILILTLFAVSIMLPFINAISVSFITEKEYLNNKLTLIPKEPTLSAYIAIFKQDWVIPGYKNSIILSFLTWIYSLTINSLAAYAITKNFPGKKLVYLYFLIPMFFSGGLIPTYLVIVKLLGLKDTLAALILPAGVSTFYILIMSYFFREIPSSLAESAKIDGASEFKIFWRIILPLSKPILATVSLFIIVTMWNEWFGALLYLTKAKNWPLQLHLRRIINQYAESSMETNSQSLVRQQVYAEGIRMAAVMVTMVPIMIVYPFLQKYFAKGIMIGAVKG